MTEINNNIDKQKDFRISVAPMMDWTTKDYRFFARLFNPNVVLYTEMVTTGAIIYGGANRHLDFNQQEHPIVLQRRQFKCRLSKRSCSK